MPEIEIQHIVSCSSADKNNPAENLLKPNGSHKWKSAAPGEKSVSCVLQLVKSSQIHSIDIGNEGSAFIEVLVGKATAASDQEFEVLLVASAFMSPLESRNNSNRNGVRMFGPDHLNNATSHQMWDRVKIVCTQPFTKLHQYGLSFIKLHSPPGNDNEETKVKKFGAFAVKDDEDDIDDNIKVGSLFASRSVKDATQTHLPSGAAAVRAASKLAEEHIKISPLLTPSSTTPTAQRRLASPSLPAPKKGATYVDNENDTEEVKDEQATEKPSLKRKSTSVNSASSSGSAMGEKSSLKRAKTEPSTPSPDKAFGRLMEKVVFVLSGFQNPYRGELRDKALEMGAVYKPDWGRGCTHLVCAFTNTPKYQQISGKGKIVTKGWILDCYKQKKLLPWRNYRLGNADSPDDDSEEDEVPAKPSQKIKDSTHKQSPGTSKVPHQPLPKQEEKGSSQTSSHSQDDTSKGTLHSATMKKKPSFNFDDTDSGGDTEDELRKVREKTEHSTNKDTKVTPQEEEDPFGCSTDEDEMVECVASAQSFNADDNGSDSGLPDLPDFFTDKHFFFYGQFETEQRRLLSRYIAAFNGEIEDYMNQRVNFVVTAQKWDKNFDQAVSENPQLIFVKPTWIIGCHKNNKLMPYQHYIVVP